ncbi:MAG: NYN domain-containing protein [Gemmatimonadota bacterium]
MNNPFHRAPHVGGSLTAVPDRGHNAALLIDFDNVTMGIRSDLSRELKALLNSEIIRGKVAVQRAYADWRRYPQYIVPLSEASIDLIFAPAYGSSKKNATDIRLAIDALELVFIRPEIYTFILLSGDSDFSSLVLKLKEYGKYVIGVGLQESSSDILVQNCDEYYSYSTITGLTKTTDAERVAFDPWVLVEKAVERMVERSDVMRSDRLKQVMVELDPSFEERKFGFAKFSKFLAEAAGKGLLDLKKLDNGQYDVAPGRKKRAGKRTRRSVRASAEEPATTEREPTEAEQELQEPEAVETEARPDTLDRAYSLLREAMEELREAGRHPARDSDVKRRLLQLRSSFDEGELGFPKFSKFLKQAHEDRIVRIERLENGQFEVSLPGGARSERGSQGGGESREKRRKAEDGGEDGARRGRGGRRGRGAQETEEPESSDRSERKRGRRRSGGDVGEATDASPPRSRARGGSRRRDDEREAEEPSERHQAEPAQEDVAAAPSASVTTLLAPEEPQVTRTPREEPQVTPTPREEPRVTPTPREEPVTVAAPPAERTRTEEAPVAAGSKAGGLTPRSQKRVRGREGPPPLLEGQVVRVPGKDGGAGNGAEAE